MDILLSTWKLKPVSCFSYMAQPPKNPKEWGKIKVKHLDDGDEYWALMEELIESESGFYHNRSALLDSMLKGQLYGLQVEESLAMCKSQVRDPVFMINPRFPTFWMLPCFCVKVRDTCQILWVHPRARRRGFGTQLVRQLNIKYAWNIMDGSQGFWKKVNIPNSNKL